ncbi:hypothetical protein [Algoriphagus sp. A40]|uniref:hypothetical protein n=1 Tax=Algoriphagus sp. A40 TaxID=1945863 RepID=UPI00352C023D
MNAAETVSNWSVDTANPNKILTVEGENLSEAEVIEKVKTTGYTIEKDQGKPFYLKNYETISPFYCMKIGDGYPRSGAEAYS